MTNNNYEQITREFCNDPSQRNSMNHLGSLMGIKEFFNYFCARCNQMTSEDNYQAFKLIVAQSVSGCGEDVEPEFASDEAATWWNGLTLKTPEYNWRNPKDRSMLFVGPIFQ